MKRSPCSLLKRCLRASTDILESKNMNSSVTPAQKSRFFSARRIALMVGVAGLGATVLMASPGFLPRTNFPLTNPAYAQAAQRPVGFADIV